MRNRAFTLIELLMVAAIISLLMSAALFRVSEAKRKAEDAHMKAESAQVSKAIYQYKEDNGGKVPGHISVTGPATLVEGSDATGGQYDTVMQELVTNRYLSSIPHSPSGDAYTYIISADETEAVFAADLNYAPPSSGLKNSCPLAISLAPATLPPNPDIDIIYPLPDMWSQQHSFSSCNAWQTPYETCDGGESPQDYDTTCYAVSNSIIANRCGCGWSAEPAESMQNYYPAELCSRYLELESPFVCNNVAPIETMYHYCEHDPVYPDAYWDAYNAYWDAYNAALASPASSICDGSTDTDYCTCI